MELRGHDTLYCYSVPRSCQIIKRLLQRLRATEAMARPNPALTNMVVGAPQYSTAASRNEACEPVNTTEVTYHRFG